ncbi:hypothetical protein EAG_14107 [Camponotus floridanus]|uniref:Uncharacterized protein n=1 Tax=Camponotus floridanus TaxID=104421 RepID=E1ZXA5_CAMFO|nr:hypothetical protein EAG_14107 [Camponotus floridanus]
MTLRELKRVKSNQTWSVDIWLEGIRRLFFLNERVMRRRPFYILFAAFVTAPDRNARGSSLMSVWSTSTGRNTVFAAQSGGAVLPTSHLPIHVHVAHAHLRNPDGHCFHKPYHDHHCQVDSTRLLGVYGN